MCVLLGCMDVKTVVTVNKDGSGTVVDTMYIDKNSPQMMQNMMENMMMNMMSSMREGQQEVEQTNDALRSLTGKGEEELNIETYKEKSKAMGEGVRFVSAKKLHDRIGKTGVEVVYAFDDIRSLRLTFTPTELPGAQDSDTIPDKNPVTFDFKQGIPIHLMINIPQEKSEEAHMPPDIPQHDVSVEPNPVQVTLMKQLFGDFRVRVLVTVDGDVIETNALHVAKKSGLEHGDSVILMDMNIGGMLKNQEGLKKLIAFGPMQDINEARARLHHIEELKIETSEHITILFQ